MVDNIITILERYCSFDSMELEQNGFYRITFFAEQGRDALFARQVSRSDHAEQALRPGDFGKVVCHPDVSVRDKHLVEFLIYHFFDRGQSDQRSSAHFFVRVA